jgi:uncharacterized membrane-anchored protein
MLRSAWRLWVVLAVQLLIVAAVPGKKLAAMFSSVEITLETRPYDPYDVLGGYYVTLRYETEVVPPGLLSDDLISGEIAWILLTKDTPAWRVISVSRRRPTPEVNEVVLEATWDGSWARLDNLRRFYISEAVRDDVARAMAKTNGRGYVDVKVGPNGEAVLIRLRVGDKTFGSARH